MLRAFLLASCAWAAIAQIGAAQASPYLPTNDRLMPAVELLIVARVIADPDPLTRPLKRDDILAALSRADTGQAAATIREIVRALHRELAPKVDGPRINLHFQGGVGGATQSRRDPLREAGSRYATWLLGMELWATMGPLVLSSSPSFDLRWRHDPDYPGRQDTPFSFRFADAYVGFQSRYADVMYGSVDRNWGPTGIEALAVSTSPYSYDHLHFRLGVPAFRVESQLGQLNDYPTPAGQYEHRWWVAHRFLFRPWPWMTAIIGQGTLWRGGGPTSQTWFLNPTRLAVFSREDDLLADSANTVVSGDLQVTLAGGVKISAQGLIDDMANFHEKTAPNRMAGTLMVDVPVSQSAGVRGIWTLVSSLAYRTFDGPIMSLMRHNTGLGRNYGDYMQFTVSGSVAPAAGIVLQPEATLLLQGEGDIRKPMPPFPAGDYPFLLVGVQERTFRLGGALQALARGHFDIAANAGIHFISNRANVAGASATRFVGGLTIRYWIGGEFRTP